MSQTLPCGDDDPSDGYLCSCSMLRHCLHPCDGFWYWIRRHCLHPLCTADGDLCGVDDLELKCVVAPCDGGGDGHPCDEKCGLCLKFLLDGHFCAGHPHYPCVPPPFGCPYLPCVVLCEIWSLPLQVPQLLLEFPAKVRLYAASGPLDL